MSESEFLEAINLHAANAISVGAIIWALGCGYIVVAYVAGAKLSKIQTIIVSISYVIVIITWGTIGLIHVDSCVNLVAAHPSYIHSVLWLLPLNAGWVAGYSVGVIVSLYFMYDVRSKVGKSNT
ncbi:MAG: hypothetical protein ACI9G5_000095 [Paracoccaceae bacterium]|jgi:hypothetical protein